MPLSVKQQKLIQKQRVKYPDKHFCPRCMAIHHWQAMSCRRPECYYVGPLTPLNEKKPK